MSTKQPRGTVAARFWPKVAKSDTCWLWQGAVDSRGYGVMGLGGRKLGVGRVHRLSWEMVNGPIPPNALICHHCDVKQCVRPDHLYLGTKRTNAADAQERGQMSTGKRHPVPRGMAHWKAKLTDEQVADIRRLRADGQTLHVIGQTFGISEAHVSRIAKGLSRIT